MIDVMYKTHKIDSLTLLLHPFTSSFGAVTRVSTSVFIRKLY